MEYSLADHYVGAAPKDKVVSLLRELEETTISALQTRKVNILWKEVAAQIHGIRLDGSADHGLQYADPERLAIKFRINLTRPNMHQMIQLAQGKKRLSFQAQAINGSLEALTQVGIANKLLAYFVREANLDALGYKSLESDISYGRGSIWVRWDPDAGAQVDGEVPELDENGKPAVMPASVDPITGQEIPAKKITKPGKVKSGAPKSSFLFPWQHLKDTMLDDSPWAIIKEPVSKWELVAQYEEYAAKIAAMQLDYDARLGDLETLGWNQKAATKDVVILRHFFHRPSMAVPKGRWIGYVGDLVLWDLPCPTAQLPVVDFCTIQYPGTQIGYPGITDHLALQDAVNECATATITNTMRFGTFNYVVPKSAEYDRDDLEAGGAFIKLADPSDKVSVLEYPQVPEGAKYLMETLPDMMTQLAGLNPVAQGDTTNVNSGSMAALYMNTAESMQGQRQIIYDDGMVKVMNLYLELVRANAKNGFMADVSGESEAPFMQFFTTEALQGVHQVRAVRRDPAADSFPVRMEALTTISQLPEAQQAKFIEFLFTGNSEPLTENSVTESGLIKYENEQLMKGDMNVIATITDNPTCHVPDHVASLNRARMLSPGPQRDAIIQAHLLHISRHGAVWGGADPLVSQAVGIPMPKMGAPTQLPVQPETTDTGNPNPQEEPDEGLPRLPKPAEPPEELSPTQLARN